MRALHLLVASCLVSSVTGPTLSPYPFPGGDHSTLSTRFQAPRGFHRVEAPSGSFARYLRDMSLLPSGTPVHLFDGTLKARQDVHAAVLDLSVGTKDLQQCADAVMRLRAEHLFACGRQEEIAFRFTNGFLAAWPRWRAGERVRVTGSACSWQQEARPDSTHAALLRFLETVFMYAGTLSLERELVEAEGPVEPGDVFIRGGSPGHAMIVVDVALHPDGRRAFLLAQSYMPAQQVHVVHNMGDKGMDPWYVEPAEGSLRTPEWTFREGQRRRWPRP